MLDYRSVNICKYGCYGDGWWAPLSIRKYITPWKMKGCCTQKPWRFEWLGSMIFRISRLGDGLRWTAPAVNFQGCNILSKSHDGFPWDPMRSSFNNLPKMKECFLEKGPILTGNESFEAIRQFLGDSVGFRLVQISCFHPLKIYEKLWFWFSGF